jgi:hypothetical protein
MGVGAFMVPALILAGGVSLAAAQALEVPKPGVSEIFTIQGEFVRVAYNNEGYSSLGYRVANQSVGEEWMLLEVGLTLREGGNNNFILKREGLSISTPDDKTIPLATNKEYRGGDLRALEMRAKVVRDSVNYFPPGASRACRVGFFAALDSPTMAFDQVDLSWQRACMGRLYFKVPGGIQHGQHFLNVQFEKSKLRVPFRILTKEEEKRASKNWQDVKKELDKHWAEGAKKK